MSQSNPVSSADFTSPDNPDRLSELTSLSGQNVEAQTSDTWRKPHRKLARRSLPYGRSSARKSPTCAHETHSTFNS
ncbi:Uncharacterised protein [Ralstonia pickettii]|nr:hypothetical protein HMPREF0989_02236 [Ralstonia sp. 5_2_56FAA]QQK35372.1 hypothetical protein RP6297_01576 [Ralstonia pickettii]SCW96775.1 hypothetical protein SAMN02799637_04286 [Ralstonia sp. UNCCL144]SUD99498.1 Uncharacterised protein [Ralstonia pickettii]